MIRRLPAALLLAGWLFGGGVNALELTTEEAVGKRLYREGIGAVGGGAARVGWAGTPVAGTSVPCAGCHGPDGQGRPEGGLRPPAITWQELTKPYGHRHDNGREHPPFDLPAFVRAVTEGVDPAGRRLDPAMPRYALAASEIAALAAYLRRIEADRDPGVAADRLRIGTVLPGSGPLAESGALVEKLLRGVFDGINAAGGIHGRRLELVVIDGAGLSPLGPRLEAADIFALVAPLAPGRGEELLAGSLPVIGPLAGEAGDGSGQVFRLGAGERELGRVLAEFAALRLGLADPEAVLVVPRQGGGLAAAVQGQLARHGWTRVSRQAPGLDPAATVAEWRRRGVAAIFNFAGPEGLAALQAAAAAAGWKPAFLAPAAHAGAGAQAGTFVAVPYLAGDGTPAGRRALDELRRRQEVPPRQPALQAAVYAAAAVLAEGLKRAGRGTSRERLADAVENLYAFDTGVMPPVTFGPGRRLGVMGGYVLRSDSAAGGWRPAAGFVALEQEQ